MPNRGRVDRSAAASANKKVAGFGRLRRPSTQPAFWLAEPGNQISVGKVAEPGNRMVEAGSATSEALAEIGRASGLQFKAKLARNRPAPLHAVPTEGKSKG